MCGIAGINSKDVRSFQESLKVVEEMTHLMESRGPDAKGNKVLNAPNLTGLQDWYLVRQLKNFKKGIRGAHPEDTYGQQMRPMSMTLADDNTINNVVAHILSLRK